MAGSSPIPTRLRLENLLPDLHSPHSKEQHVRVALDPGPKEGGREWRTETVGKRGREKGRGGVCEGG